MWASAFLGYALANTEFSLPWRLVIYVLGIAGSLAHILVGPYLVLNHPGLGGFGDRVPVCSDDFLGRGGVRVLQISAAESPAGGGSDGSA